jgi:hypothetical protein
MQSRQAAVPPVPVMVPDANLSAPVQTNATSVVGKDAKPAPVPAPKPTLQVAATPASKEPASNRKVKEKSPKAEKPAVVQPQQAKPASERKSRLKLDPADSLSERIKSLETSSTANSVQEDLARDNQKMQQLQSDLRSLLEQAVKNEASLAAMRERMEKAESDRVPLAMVYALITLLVLCAGILAYVLTRRPRFANQNAAAKPGSVPNTDSTALNANQVSAGEVPHSQTEETDVDLLELNVEPFADRAAASAAPIPVTKSKSRYHNFNADPLVDLRQQADFLAKLGKVDEALEVLEGGIRANPVGSPLLFLDLLVIANNFSRKTDFRQFSAEFAQLFNATVPEFALFRDEGRKLDAYPALLEHINSQWESPHVLDVIEACILRDADATESDPFDLAAFRELLKMHAAASENHRTQAVKP